MTTVGYRRAAMKLPLTENENGARGTWLEKRRAFLGELTLRQHMVHFLSEPTKESAAAGHRRDASDECDVLVIEFAGLNMQFYGEAWRETAAMATKHKGPIIFLCDDPDLPFQWDLMPGEDWFRWTIALNAVYVHAAGRALKVPRGAKLVDAPFASLLMPADFSDGQDARAIYIGRGNGRKKTLARYLDDGQVVVAGNAKEWPGRTVLAQPTQSERRAFYRGFRAGFAACDKKHIETGWRTGRAYHALYAGIPVLTPWPEANAALEWTVPVSEAEDVGKFLQVDGAYRRAIHAAQLSKARDEFPWVELGL